jgi:hypothetical protein
MRIKLKTRIVILKTHFYEKVATTATLDIAGFF